MFWTIVLAVAFVVFVIPLLFQIVIAILNALSELESPGWVIFFVVVIVLLILIF